LIHDYALQIPTTIIAETLGIPVKDRLKFPPLVERGDSVYFFTLGSIDGSPACCGFPALHPNAREG
jgi:cytochrome P450